MAPIPPLIAYVAVFALAGIVCIAAAVRARSRIEEPDTRRGITWLLLASGAWSLSHVGFLVAPGDELKTTFYLFGLIVGLSAVGPWLYFCSAYTGRTLHRNGGIRAAAVGVFVAVVAVKLTNPIHQLYFTTETVASPFPHLAIQHGTFHWIVMGFSYALAAVGYFMLLELFVQVDFDTRPFVVLVSFTGLPVVLDVLGQATPFLLDITYEPLGVAVFAVGVFAVYLDRFQAIRLAAGHDDAVVVLDDDGRLRDFNREAAALFPALEDPEAEAVGAEIEAVLPTLASALDADADVVTIERDGAPRYYRVTANPFGADHARLGRLVTLTDVTESEQYRRELERQNERLDQFASVVSHDLRNPLSVAIGRLDIAREEHGSEHLEVVDRALDRMATLIEDVLALAREGRPIDEVEPVELAPLARECWELIDAAGGTLDVEDDIAFRADPDRLRQLLENLFRNAVDHGGDDVAITVGALPDGDGFYVEDDGPGVPPESRDEVFESGFTTDEHGTGFGLSIVREIAEAHGWAVRVTDGGGARFEVTGVQTDG